MAVPAVIFEALNSKRLMRIKADFLIYRRMTKLPYFSIYIKAL